MRKKVILVVLLLVFISINLLSAFRWQIDSETKNEMQYKIDRWTGQMWVDFYPPNASVSKPFEFPVFNNEKYVSIDKMDEIVKLNSISGRLVEIWLKRVSLTHLYIAFNIILIITFVVAIFQRSKKYLYGRR